MKELLISRRRLLKAGLAAPFVRGAKKAEAALLRGGAGPSSSSDPFQTLVNGISPGNWALANSPTQSDGNLVNPPDAVMGNINGSQAPFGLASTLGTWGSLGYDTKRKRLYSWGGGHSGYFGNELYQFDLKTGLWSRCMMPSQVYFWPVAPSVCTTVGLNNAIDPNAYPTAPENAGHPYLANLYLPVLDRFCLFSAFHVDSNNNPTGPYTIDPDVFDPVFNRGTTNASGATQMVGGLAGSNPLYPTLICPAGNMWVDRATWPTWRAQGVTCVNDAAMRTNIAVVENGQDVIYFAAGGSSGSPVWRWAFDPVGTNDVVTTVGAADGTAEPPEGLPSDYAPEIKCFLSFTQNPWVNGKPYAYNMQYWDMGTPGRNNQAVNVTVTDLSGYWASYAQSYGTPPSGHAPGGQMKWTWDPTVRPSAPNGRFTMWGGGASVFYLTPSYPLSSASSAWPITLAPAPTSATPPALNGITGPQPISILGRWVFLPDYKVFIGIQDQTGQVWVFMPTP